MKKRKRRKAKWKLVKSSRGPSILLLNSKNRVVNAINGGPKDTLATMRKAAKKWFPDAVETHVGVRDADGNLTGA